jgi:hypothetical protein
MYSVSNYKSCFVDKLQENFWIRLLFSFVEFSSFGALGKYSNNSYVSLYDVEIFFSSVQKINTFKCSFKGRFTMFQLMFFKFIFLYRQEFFEITLFFASSYFF